MSKNMLAIIIVVIIVVVGGGGLLIAHNHKSNNSTTPATSTTSSQDTMNMNNKSASNTSTSSSSSSSSQSNAVTIENFAFSPADITVKKGTTVTWTNKDSTAHTVTETDGKTGPDSGNLDNGKTFSFTYNSTGTFKYHCSIHSSMTGSVTVTD